MESLLGGDATQWEESFRKIPLAKVHSLFQGRLHPQAAALLEKGKAWAEERIAPVMPKAAMQKLRGDNCGGLALYMYPNAEPARAMTLMKFTYWIIIFDDVADDPLIMGGDSHRLQRYARHFLSAMFEGGDAHSDDFTEPELLPVHVGLEWWEEMKRTAAPSQQVRMEAAVRAYVMTQLPCAAWREEWAVWLNAGTSRGAPPCSLEELVPLWREASGAGMVLLLVEYDLGINLQAESLADPLLQHLIEAGADHLDWLNCIFSFPKDVEKQEALNFLTCLHLRSTSLPEMLTQAWDTITAIEQECARLATRLIQQSRVSEDTKLYADAMCTLLASHWMWCLDSARYPHTL